MTTRLLLLLTLLLPAGALAGEAADPVDERLARVAAAYAEVTSLEADFVQTSTGMSYLEPLVQTGTIALQKPGQMAWLFTGAQQFLSDGSTLWIVDPRDQTCTVYRGMNAVLSRYFGFLTGMSDVRSHYAVTATEEGGLNLAPTDPNDTMGSIAVTFDAASGLVASLKVTNPFGDQTEVTLSNVRTGTKLTPETFVYTDRPGYRTIEGS